MSVIGLNHVNIRSRDVLASAQFYAQVLQLRPQNGPMGLKPEQSQWLLDANDQPIIHLRQYDSEPGPTGPIDHVALSCADVEGTVAQLTTLGIDFKRFDTEDVTILFMQDPHGVQLELRFAE